jgi:hypothetical protein
VITQQFFNLTQKVVIPANDEVVFVGTTNGKQVQFLSESYDASLGGFEIELKEGVSFTGGQVITGVNRNTTSAQLATMILTGGANVSGGNTLFLKGVPLADTPQARTRAVNEIVTPWLLNSGTNYAIILRNLNNVDLTVYTSLDWAEYELL